ncbi:MAG: hypothetical protein IRZ05_00590 [Micromonosporaceae bacterium]|jgi:hypothetical protein|nr:hypothetical protein [Micromonosporaceae bacterium]
MTALLVAATAAITAVLLRAGVGKLALPASLAAALAELLGQAAVPASAVRLLAAGELTLALLVPFVGGATATQVVVAALGLAFAAVGVAGQLRGTRLPCGCFGSASGTSFGAMNIAAGAALVGWAVLAWAHPLPDGYRPAALLLGLNLVVAGFCLRNRRYIPMFFNAVTAIRRAS